MPEGEDCEIAKALRSSLQGSLIPLSRFCLFEAADFHYTEGIAYADHKDGRVEPSMAVDFGAAQAKALWADPEKRPWRELTALLAFGYERSTKKQYSCLQLRTGLKRIRENTARFAIWSGGMLVSNKVGEQYAGGGDDYVESAVWVNSESLENFWFDQLCRELEGLEEVFLILQRSIDRFFAEQKMDKGAGNKLATKASGLFWQLCERNFQELVYACGDPATDRQIMRRRFAAYAWGVYDQFCPQETARQLAAWANHRPNFSKNKYLHRKEDNLHERSAGGKATRPGKGFC
jgi:CRISPR system Cascade subunit CasA